MKQTLLLVDASGYVFRSHYALVNQGLTAPDGQPTHVILGVLNMLERLQKQYPASLLIMVFDGKGNGVRQQWHPDYKANRPPTPPEIKSQIAPLHKIIQARGLPLIVEDDIEADDVIATLIEQGRQKFPRIIIATADKDLAQLVDDQVSLLVDDKNNILMDAAAVQEKYGVPPQLIPDYLSLVGDKVDNIPGVEKVGPKTASTWLQEYGSLSGVMENAEQIGGKIGENLRAALKQLPLALRLNSSIRDAQLTKSLAELQPQPADTKQLQNLYIKFGLSRLLSSLTAESTAPALAVQLINTDAQWAAAREELTKAATLALAALSDGKDNVQGRLLALALATSPEKCFYLPVAAAAGDELLKPSTLDLTKVTQDLTALLTSGKTKLIAHDLKHLLHLLANQDCAVQLGKNCDDTMLMSYLSNSAQKHDLISLATKLLRTQLPSNVAVFGKHGENLAHLADEQIANHLGSQATACLRLEQQFSHKLQQDGRPYQVYQQLDLPLVPCLLEMERHGVLLDLELLRSQSLGLATEMAQVAKQAFALAGGEFNLNSPAQLKELLYDKMQFPVSRKTSSGQPSTAEDVLIELAKEHEFPQLILDYRGLSKLKSTYTEALPRLADPTTNRVHTSFNQAVASTGRLSSANPNLQNIPIRTAAGRNVRAAFIAAPGMVLAAADYSQIELRIMAHLSQDNSLLAAFAAGQDVHVATAAEIFNVSPPQVTREQRRRAKIANFGLIYGMSHFGLAKQLGITKQEAQDFIALYFSRYPGVQRYMDETRTGASKYGWAETLSGRRVYLPEINSSNFNAKQGAIRAAINAPVQGSAADLIKAAMIKLRPQLKAGEAKMIMQVHDELVFEIRADLLDKYRQLICDTMVAVTPLNGTLSVPLEVDFGSGSNWKDAH